MRRQGHRYAWYKLLTSRFITRYWWIVIVSWIVLAIVLRSVAPAWKDIAADGDLAFLPDWVPSSIGQQALKEAFPGSETRSQMVLIVANPAAVLAASDLALGLDLSRHLHWLAAQSAWQELNAAGRGGTTAGQIPTPSRVGDAALAEVVRDNLTQVLEIEAALSRFFEAHEAGGQFKRMPQAHQIRGELLEKLGESEAAAVDLDIAKLMREQSSPVISEPLPSWFPFVRDVWSWRDPVLGHKLQSGNEQAKLIAVQLGTDFTAVGNIEILAGMEALIAKLRKVYQPFTSADLRVEVAGSAAVGADMLRAAASGVKQTEIVTIVLVLLILAFVYRAPFLVAIPLTSIGLSLFIATSIIAILARDPADPVKFGLGVFTTTRVFIVVLLFGAGTDFCLFLLARCRELIEARSLQSRREMYGIVASGWRSVHDALVASALTTIVGLGLMWFSDFEKFKFSGPIIAISLAVTLMVCLSFTPALLCGIGKAAFWPQFRSRAAGKPRQPATVRHNHWGRLAEVIVARPLQALIMTLIAITIPAAYGMSCLGRVTYDLPEELSENAASRRGSQLISQFFSTSDSSPITVVVARSAPFESDATLRQACDELSAALYMDGVDSVRSLSDPLGDYPPGKRMGLFGQDAWRRRILLGHRMTKERYVSSVEGLSRRVAKFDVVLHDNPFSLEAGATLARVRAQLDAETSKTGSAWLGTRATTSGTTVGITDLRQITQADQRRIQLLVTLGVWLVLVIMLRQWVLSTYLVGTVLLSYFATLGVTYFLFSSLYADYSGLDWKVPLFLFVILIAVGQDYNVYLVTRIFEEQRNLGVREGVRKALTLTGGIITSCGLVMAGTFIAMTSPAVAQSLGQAFTDGSWVSQTPVLRGITELGFALAFGVLLDTLVVRSILVPAFVLVWQGKGHAEKLGIVSKGG